MKEGKRYKVTGWHPDNPQRECSVWVTSVDDEQVAGHMTGNGTQGVVAIVWPRTLAAAWNWQEITDK